MRKYLCICLFALFIPPLFGQEVSEITNIDIVEILQEINQKIDNLQAEKELQSSGRLTMSLLPITFRYIFDMDVMDGYLTSQGDFDPLDDFMIPVSNGYEFFFRYRLVPEFSLGIRAMAYSSSSLGLHGMESDYAMSESLDNNVDGFTDSYSYMTFFLGGIQLNGLYQLPIINERYKWNAGANIGLGSSRIIFSNTTNSFWTTLAGNADAEARWSRSYFILGGFSGFQIKTKGFLVDLNIGFDYYFPIEEWSPDYGIEVGDSPPPDGFSPYNFWISISPSILF